MSRGEAGRRFRSFRPESRKAPNLRHIFRPRTYVLRTRERERERRITKRKKVVSQRKRVGESSERFIDGVKVNKINIGRNEIDYTRLEGRF